MVDEYATLREEAWSTMDALVDLLVSSLSTNFEQPIDHEDLTNEIMDHLYTYNDIIIRMTEMGGNDYCHRWEVSGILAARVARSLRPLPGQFFMNHKALVIVLNSYITARNEGLDEWA